MFGCLVGWCVCYTLLKRQTQEVTLPCSLWSTCLKKRAAGYQSINDRKGKLLEWWMKIDKLKGQTDEKFNFDGWIYVYSLRL